MKQNIVCNFRAIMMIGLAAFLLLFSEGCGEQQKEQTGDAKDLIATGSAVYVDGEQDAEEVQKQLELLVKNVDKWRIDAGKKKSLEIGYAVTDLDHNGRLEIMALGNDWQDEEDSSYRLRKIFEVNSSGDGIQEIGTEQIQDVPLCYDADIEKLSTAYFDPETGEYHYVMEGMWDDEEDAADIVALTLTDGQITKTTLGTWEQPGKKAKDIRYFRVDAQGKTEITEEEYSVENLGTLSYPNCGKFDVGYSVFTLEGGLEEHIYRAMEKAYGECFQGYPLERQEKEIHGYSIEVPQYTTIRDRGKQKRINQLICEQIEQSLSDVYELDSEEFDLEYANITIKYAGRNRVSLLLEARGYREETVLANEHCDTINIDLEQEKILSGQDILPEEYQEEVEEEIKDEDTESIRGGDDYREMIEENEGNLFPTRRAQGWQDVKIYQTRDGVGIVIPKKFGLDAYVIYEVEIPRGWESYLYMKDKGVASYPYVDWEAYQYKMLPAEYQSLQSYMPVLTGGNEFTLIEEDWTGDEMEVERRNITIADLAGEYGGEDMADETLVLSFISICDLTQDGKDEVVLNFQVPSTFYLILHKEGDAYYGIIHGRRSLYDLQKNGVYGAGKNGLNLYQTRFEKDTFIETYIGGYEYERDDSGEDECKYYIGDKEVEKEEYKKWKKSIAAEEVLWYTPEILQEKIEKLKSER